MTFSVRCIKIAMASACPAANLWSCAAIRLNGVRFSGSPGNDAGPVTDSTAPSLTSADDAASVRAGVAAALPSHGAAGRTVVHSGVSYWGEVRQKRS